MSENLQLPVHRGVRQTRLMLISLLCLVAMTVENQETSVVSTHDGKSFALTGRIATVVLFLADTCPIANDMQPKVRALYEKHTQNGVGFLGVHIDPRLESKDVAGHAKEYGIKYSLTVDQEHRLVKQFGAKITPEVFVLDKDGKVIYRGRIDDTYVEIGVRKSTATRHDLANAIEAALLGKKPAVSRTDAIGCLIPKLSDF